MRGAKRKMRKKKGVRGWDNEKEGSETGRGERQRKGLWGKDILGNKGE